MVLINAPIKNVSESMFGRSQISAYLVNSVSLWSITINFDPFATACFIGIDAIFCSSVMFEPTTNIQSELNSSHIRPVAP